MPLVLLPAVDVADGAAVRLVQGAAGTETSYGEPLEAALSWQRDGAEWIHLVDLDAAFGRGDNRELLASRGWTQEGGDLWETLARLDADGCARYVLTDVHRDGILTGPNLQLLRDVCARTPAAVVASGGVSSL